MINFMYLRIFFILFPLFLCAKIEQLAVQVVTKIPHPLPAFTQGLSIEDDQLYETTGLYGKSNLRLLDLVSGDVKKTRTIDSKLFAEGLAVFPDCIVLLTWREQQALVIDRKSWKNRHILFYSGEGWGLCRDGETVWMSNGTSFLTQREMKTFTPLKTIQVTFNDSPLEKLNDLVCVGNDLYVNIWQKDWIARIEKKSGKVTGVIDASSLLTDIEKKKRTPNDVLNGIAFREKTGTFYLTGKEWPWIYEVRFVSD